MASERTHSTQTGHRSAGILTAVVFFSVALVPRLSAIWRGFVTSDELAQVFDAIRFARALQSGHWLDAGQANQVGIVASWAGTLSIWGQRWRDVAGTDAHLEWIGRVPWFSPDNVELSRHLAPFLPYSRLVIAVLTALGAAGIYVLVRRLWGHRTALIGTALLALDPFVVGRSSLFGADALAMTAVTVGLLAWLVALADKDLEAFRRRAPVAVISGLCAGCGALSGVPVMLTIPIFAASALLHFLLAAKPTRSRGKQHLLLVPFWIAGAAAALVGLFPTMWTDPLGAWGQLVALPGVPSLPSTGSLEGPVATDAGPLSYGLSLLFLLTPVALVGLTLSLLPLVTRWRSPQANRQRAQLVSLWVLVVGLGLMCTSGWQVSDRGWLLAVPALDLLAASGWMLVVRGIDARLRRSPRSDRSTRAFSIALTVLIAAQGAVVLTGWPYYLDAYNPLLNGPGAALRTPPAAVGEGVEQIAWILNDQAAGAAGPVVAASNPATLAPLYDGRVVPLESSSPVLADKLLITARDRQAAPERVAQWLSGAHLAHTVRAGRRDVLWLYDVQHHAEAEHLARYGAPADVILCDASTPFVRHPGSWDVTLIADADEAQIIAKLDEWSASHTRLWYLSYPVASPITTGILRYQLDTYAAQLDRVDLGYATATLYILPEGPAFSASDGTFQPVQFGSQIALVGAAALQRNRSVEERTVYAQLRWQATAAPQSNYEAVVRLVDAGGNVRAASSNMLLVDRWSWPTRYWLAGDVVEATYAIDLDGLPSGRYQLAVGLVDAETETWLPVTGTHRRTEIVLSVDVSLPAASGPAGRGVAGHRTLSRSKVGF